MQPTERTEWPQRDRTANFPLGGPAVGAGSELHELTNLRLVRVPYLALAMLERSVRRRATSSGTCAAWGSPRTACPRLERGRPERTWLRGLVQLAAALHPAPRLAPARSHDAPGRERAGRGGGVGLRPARAHTGSRDGPAAHGLGVDRGAAVLAPLLRLVDHEPEAGSRPGERLSPASAPDQGFLEYAQQRGLIADPNDYPAKLSAYTTRAGDQVQRRTARRGLAAGIRSRPDRRGQLPRTRAARRSGRRGQELPRAGAGYAAVRAGHAVRCALADRYYRERAQARLDHQQSIDLYELVMARHRATSHSSPTTTGA